MTRVIKLTEAIMNDVVLGIEVNEGIHNCELLNRANNTRLKKANDSYIESMKSLKNFENDNEYFKKMSAHYSEVLEDEKRAYETKKESIKKDMTALLIRRKSFINEFVPSDLGYLVESAFDDGLSFGLSKERTISKSKHIKVTIDGSVSDAIKEQMIKNGIKSACNAKLFGAFYEELLIIWSPVKSKYKDTCSKRSAIELDFYNSLLALLSKYEVKKAETTKAE